MAYIHDANFTPSVKDQPLQEGTQIPQKETTYVDEYLKLRQQKKMERLIEEEMGIGESKVKEPQQQPAESLAATIVTKAMELSSKANERAEHLADRNDDIAQKARLEADKAKSDLFSITAQQIGGALENIKELRQEIKQGSPPRDLVTQVKEARELLTVLSPPQPKEAPAPVGVDSTVTIALEKMRMDHEMTIKGLDLQLQKMNQEFQIQLSKINTDNSYKKQEYEDSKNFKSRGLDTLSDAAAAIAAGFAGAGAGAGQNAPVASGPVAFSPPGASPVAETVAEPPIATMPYGDGSSPAGAVAGEQPIQAKVTGFPCQNCQTKVTVLPGATTAICSKCGSDYEITYK
jgi:hypothetical protein